MNFYADYVEDYFRVPRVTTKKLIGICDKTDDNIITVKECRVNEDKIFRSKLFPRFWRFRNQFRNIFF